MTDFEKTYQNYNPRQTALDEARALLTAAAKAAMADGALPEAELPAFIVEIPADVKNGDIASNIAMAGARTWRKAPKMIADALIAHLPALDGGVFAKVEVAGPGFINLFLAPSFWAGVVLGACSNKEYGRTDHGKGAKYNVEFVSANPTGPMHMGNARGGALGDCLAAVLDWSGYDVTREFYINDAGNQIQKFGKSLAVRYLQKYCGEEAYPLPAECYQGGDIKVLAGEFAELNGDKYVASCKGMDEETLFESEAFAALKDALVAYALPKNIAALIALGGQRIGFLAAELLQVAHGQALAELLDLVTGIVDVKLAGHIIAGPVQHSGQTVAQSAAAGIAHVHGAGGVGGNELHIILGTLAVVGAAILLVGAGTQYHTGPVSRGQEQVDETGAGDLDLGKHAVGQVGQVGQQGLCDHPGGLAPGTGTGHGQVGGDVAVLHVGGDLHDEGGQLGFRQGAVGHGGLCRSGQQRTGLVQCSLPGVVILVGLFKFSHWSDSFHSIGRFSSHGSRSLPGGCGSQGRRCWHPADRRTARCRPSRSVRSRSRRRSRPGS